MNKKFTQMHSPFVSKHKRVYNVKEQKEGGIEECGRVVFGFL